MVNFFLLFFLSGTVGIFLEMLTRARRFNRALAFFRLVTGTEQRAGDNEDIKLYQKHKDLGFQYVDKPNAFHYGVLIRGASSVGRFEDAAYLINEMQSLGFEPRDVDTFMLRRKILSMDFDDLDDAEDYIISILGDRFARRLIGGRKDKSCKKLQ